MVISIRTALPNCMKVMMYTYLLYIIFVVSAHLRQRGHKIIIICIPTAVSPSSSVSIPPITITFPSLHTPSPFLSRKISPWASHG